MFPLDTLYHSEFHSKIYLHNHLQNYERGENPGIQNRNLLRVQRQLIKHQDFTQEALLVDYIPLP